ncbi:MAG: FkbM family methyltransferase, partial [Planctomycetota bacterium]
MIDQLRLRARAFKYRRKLDPGPVEALLGAVKPGDRCLDLGAHKGAYTHWLATAAGAKGQVVAVEPQPELAERLKDVMSGKPWVSVEWAGISDTTGAGRLDIRGAGASHGASLTGLDGEVARTIDVPTLTIGDVIEKHALGGVEFIKIDVEGHELATLGAAEGVLREHRPTVLCECEARHHGGDTDSIAA